MGNRPSSHCQEQHEWGFEIGDLVEDLASIGVASVPPQSARSAMNMASNIVNEPGMDRREGKSSGRSLESNVEVEVANERRSASGAATSSGRDASFAQAAELLLRGQCVVAFTGAGISVDSGIPDFRSPSGLWARFDPSIYCSYPAFLQRPELFWTLALEMQRLAGDAQPNRGHAALVELEKLAGLRCVITQNVDALHQRAGSSVVHELHGTVCTMKCVACKKKRLVSKELKQLQQLNKKELARSDVPVCAACGNAMKMDVVLFGEALQYSVLQGAMAAAAQADVILVVGTSLSVAPANTIVQQRRARGAKVILCNLDDSGQEFADVVLQGSASDTLVSLVTACTESLDENRKRLEHGYRNDSGVKVVEALASQTAGRL